MEASYQFDEAKHVLGPLCKAGHDWHGTGQSLRQRGNTRCVECQKESKARRTDEQKERKRMADLQRYHDNKSNKEWLAKRNCNATQNTARSRLRRGRPSRAKGLEGIVLPVGLDLPSGSRSGVRRYAAELIQSGLSVDEIKAAAHEYEASYKAFQRLKANPAPTVAELVMAEQRRHWRECPKDRQEHVRQWAKECDRFRRMTDEGYRLYHRQKSKRKKAMMRGSMVEQISGELLAIRYKQFGDVCAYCGRTDDLQIEHVMPIAKGGAHVIENIVPACRKCNSAKRDHDVERWYRAQPFFSEVRWRAIRKATGWLGGGAQQRKLA